jgi:DNA-binding NarL/FixJ family response regulator
MPVHEAPRVLLVDTAVARRDVVQRLVESPAVGALVVGTATDAASAVAAVGTLAPTVVVLEIQLPVDTGLDTLAALHRAFPRLPVVVCSFCSDTHTTTRAAAAGATSYLKKPVAAMYLREALSHAASDTAPPTQERGD